MTLFHRSSCRAGQVHSSAFGCLIAALCLSTAGAAAQTAVSGPEMAAVSQTPGVDRGNRAAVNVVEVTSTGMNFDAPDEIPSGWTTFRYHNATGMTHFAQLERLPNGIGVADQQLEVAPVFQRGMDLLNGGRFDDALAAFGQLPAWFFEVVFTGGPGLTAPGHTSETTVYLEPGTYLLECYMKTNGIFHSFDPSGDTYGMVREITVAEARSRAREPEPTLELAISSGNGIRVDQDIRPGKHTIAVHFEDQVVHGHFLGHDVHLVRLQDDTDMAALATWMDWTQPTGLEVPAPAEFLGGVSDMPAGSTGYMSVVLTPGRYAWIAEVPDPAGKDMLKTFTVPSGNHTGH